MTKDEALKLALRALERLACLGNGVMRGNSIGNQIAIDALTAIKEALAQPKPCEYCYGTGDVHNNDGEWRGVCICGIGKALAQQGCVTYAGNGTAGFSEGERPTGFFIQADKRQPEHDKTDVRCECCGYMTYHREHLGCIRAAKLKEPEQEPVAQCTESDSWNCKYCRKTESCKALQDPRNFAYPPQRKPLTDEEVVEVARKHVCGGLEFDSRESLLAFFKEAAHGIKGEA